MFTRPQISNGDNDQKTCHPQRRQNVEHLSALEVDEQKNDQRQTKNPEVSQRAAFLIFCGLNSLTHELWNRHSHRQRPQRAGTDVSKYFREALRRERSHWPHIDDVIRLQKDVVGLSFSDRVVIEFQIL